ncbi:MAG: zf-HC2 domain-containing protein [Gemmatimonadetes bacterium]|nr:zf-HC2 domain-containing protein [Gemmatimonadota bacterium]
MTRTDCLEALARLYEFLDGELDAADAAAVRHHMEVCAGCYPFLQFCGSFQDALHRAAKGQPAAPPELRQRIASLLRNEGLKPHNH